MHEHTSRSTFTRKATKMNPEPELPGTHAWILIYHWSIDDSIKILDLFDHKPSIQEIRGTYLQNGGTDSIFNSLTWNSDLDEAYYPNESTDLILSVHYHSQVEQG